MIIRAISMSIVFLYLMPVFLVHFIYFAKRKFEAISGQISLCGIFIILWTLVMWLSKVWHGLATIVLVTLERLDPDISDGVFQLYSFSMRTYTYFVDFLNMATLLYLFYH